MTPAAPEILWINPHVSWKAPTSGLREENRAAVGVQQLVVTSWCCQGLGSPQVCVLPPSGAGREQRGAGGTRHGVGLCPARPGLCPRRAVPGGGRRQLPCPAPSLSSAGALMLGQSCQMVSLVWICALLFLLVALQDFLFSLFFLSLRVSPCFSDLVCLSPFSHCPLPTSCSSPSPWPVQTHHLRHGAAFRRPHRDVAAVPSSAGQVTVVFARVLSGGAFVPAVV